MKNKWGCDICAREFVKEVDLLAHQFNSSCEKQLREREQGMNDSAITELIEMCWSDKTPKGRQLQKAEDELTALRARVTELEAAIQNLTRKTHGINDNSVLDNFKAHLTIGDIRELALLLTTKEQ